MFNRFWHDIWIVMFVLLVFIGIFSGQALVIGLGVMGLLVALVSWLWNRLSLEDVHYEREIQQTRVFRGEETKLTISLTNRKPVPLGKLDLEDEFPEEIEIVGAEVTPSSNPKSMIIATTHLDVLVRTHKLGVHHQMSHQGLLQVRAGTHGKR